VAELANELDESTRVVVDDRARHRVERQHGGVALEPGGNGFGLGETGTRDLWAGEDDPPEARRSPAARASRSGRPAQPLRRAAGATYYRLPDYRVDQLLALARSLLADNAEHVAACRVIDGKRC
jgi:hypothetical protein